MKRTYSFVMALAMGAACLMAQTQWLHIYQSGPKVSSYRLDDIESINYLEQLCAGVDRMQVNAQGEANTLTISNITDAVVGTNIPEIRITIPDEPDRTDLTEKETYLSAVISINSEGTGLDLDPTPVNIKGRGNTTWNYRKKPYRLKFDSKVPLLGLKKGKSYALIGDYIDCTLMRNPIALKTAQLLGMPYTNHFIPVRVYFNDILKGYYFLTEKVGINGASVNIDETTGILFEIDENYDEGYKFKSKYYKMPVMVKDPDFDEIAAELGTTPSKLLTKWQNDYNAMEKVVNSGGDPWQYIDLDSFVDYVLVYTLTGNSELGKGKSTYIYKGAVGEKYYFGPVWDFDWAYNYDNLKENKPYTKLILNNYGLFKTTNKFIGALCKNSKFKTAFKARWNEFKTNIYPQLLEFIDEYADIIEPAAIENGQLWGSQLLVTRGSLQFRQNLETLKTWIQNRVDFISTNSNFGLY